MRGLLPHGMSPSRWSGRAWQRRRRVSTGPARSWSKLSAPFWGTARTS